MAKLHFRFRTLEEAKAIAQHLSRLCPDPDAVFYGIHEMMVNAVEHGNLGIGYARKNDLLAKGGWQEEIERRLALRENQEKYVEAIFENNGSQIVLCITDMGNGFDWQPYFRLPENITSLNGRGIMTARTLSFSAMEYAGKGNVVVCTVALDTASATHLATRRIKAGGR